MNNIKHISTIAQGKSRGFTIIEIMITLAISTVLLFGVINIFMASRTSYELQNGAARLQENARFALDNMARAIGMAGLNANPTPAFTVGAGATQEGGGVNNSDSIQVNYETTVDCVGINLPPNTLTNDVYTIQMDNGIPTLFCNGVPLVEGVESMQILYGVDTDANGIADRYVNANNVADWGSTNGGITSVRIGLLVNTVDDVDEVRQQSYQMMEAPAMNFNDNMLRRVFTRTVLVRNYTFTP